MGDTMLLLVILLLILNAILHRDFCFAALVSTTNSQIKISSIMLSSFYSENCQTIKILFCIFTLNPLSWLSTEGCVI